MTHCRVLLWLEAWKSMWTVRVWMNRLTLIVSSSSPMTLRTWSSLDPPLTPTTRSNRAPLLAAWPTLFQVCQTYLAPLIWMASAVISSETMRMSPLASIFTFTTMPMKRLSAAQKALSTSAEFSIASATRLCYSISRQAMSISTKSCLFF